MPTTAFQDLYTAAQSIMTDVNTAAAGTVTQAPTNYGDDFRITPGTALYQIQIQPEHDRLTSNVAYPRAVCTVLIHHYVLNLSDEVEFLHNMIQVLSDAWLDQSVWVVEPGIYSLQPEVLPEMEDGGREGNVITFEASAVVLMTAV